MKRAASTIIILICLAFIGTSAKVFYDIYTNAAPACLGGGC